ncbi:MAG TPA: WD40 repeat domain-containing protein, partial [Gemmataceae bacterium]|nr:WD40 repeat domain-containing protein [Gemmataceae bacterium]
MGLCVLAVGAGVVAERTSTAEPAEAQRAEGPNAVAKGAESAKKEQPKADDSKQPRTDGIGDPLPQGAIARLGTTRLRTSRYTRFSPDGRRIVLDRANGDLQIFEVPTGKPLAVIRATDVPDRKDIIGSTLAFTADGRYLAAVCWEGRCGIWETATGRLVRWLESGPFYSLLQCDFSQDGKLLAVGAGTPAGRIEGIKVGVYEVESGRQLFTVLGTNSAFARDNRSLLTWDPYPHNSQQTARRVAIPTGKELATFSYHEKYYDFAPHSDGIWFFEIAADRSIRARDAATGEVKQSFFGVGGDDQVPVYIRHAPGQRELIAVVGTRPGKLWCWDLNTGKALWDAQVADPPRSVGLSADGQTLVMGDSAGVVRVWDVAKGNEQVSFRPGTIGNESWVTISPQGSVIATTSG